ncbi:MAG: hypothetical protein COX65_00505 [Elusimicrobia bacterium CG_4_10_14_0_2_um_filter_56_8]|nr:MAG: hypothetical protein AUJ51_11350 [Elusimicrobia bacterium CG1_02_56_21]PJA17777.1 MAG: hypothetical protein COX65_00505 [Elusimicrobia bacterium CG_4_10_14_0_2_um_filter_56_8]
MDWSLLGFGAVREFFNIHPMFVHFPVAFLPGAFLLYALGIALKKPALNSAGRACLYMAAAGALAALITGVLAEDSFPHNEVIHNMMGTHETLAWIVLAASGALSAWSFFHSEQRPKSAWAFLTLLGLANLAVLQAADIGARMVYLEGAAVKPATVSIAAGTEETGKTSPLPDNQAGQKGHKHKH